MDQSLQRELEERNQRIIDAIIEKSKKVCPNSITLIGIGGSFATGDIHPKSDLDLLIVINDDDGWKIASCFILGDVAHDLYCTSWAGLEETAQYTQPYVGKLLDTKVVYCADEKHMARYLELSRQVKDILSAPLSPQDCCNAEKFLDAAAKEYAELMLAQELGPCRYAALSNNMLRKSAASSKPKSLLPPRISIPVMRRSSPTGATRCIMPPTAAMPIYP